MDRNRAKELLTVIQAYAEGKDVQYFSRVNRIWMCPNSPSFDPSVEWRIAPEKKWYRVGLMTDIGDNSTYPCLCRREDTEKGYERSPCFKRWLTDRIYYEE